MTRRDRAMAIGALLLLAIAGYGHLCAPGRVPWSPCSDFFAEHLATRQILHDSLAAGRGLPFWRSDELSGSVALTNPQANYTHPLHALFLLAPPLDALGPTMLLHFAAAALAFYAFGAALGLGAWGRMLMGTAGLFSFKMVMAAYAGWLPILSELVALPLLFATALRLFDRPDPMRTLQAAAAGAFALHAGNVQVVYFALLLLVPWALVRLASRAPAIRPTPPAGRVALSVLVAVLLAVGLSAYLLLPLAADAPLLSRAATDYVFFTGAHATTPARLLTFLYPEALGTPLDATYPGTELWEDVAYFGLVPLALAAIAVVLGRRRRHVVALAAGFAVSLLLSMDTPVGEALFDLVPGYRLFRLPARWLFVNSCLGIGLAGIGLEELRARLPGRRVASGVAAALVLLAAGEGAGYAHRYLETLPQDQALPPVAWADAVNAPAPDGPGRIAPVGRTALPFGWAASLAVQNIAGYDPFNFASYAAAFDLLQWGDVRPGAARSWYELRRLEPAADAQRLVFRPDLMDVLNVRWILSPVPLVFPDGHFAPVGTFPDQPVFRFYEGLARTTLHLYRNQRFVARAFLAPEVVTAASDGAALAVARGSDLRQVAVIQVDDASPAPASPGRPASPGDRADLVDSRPGSLEVRTTTVGPRLLVASEIWHPGWGATLDGAPVAAWRTDHALLGVDVPAGDHRVVLTFRPPLWDLGVAITLASLLACIGLAALGMGSRTVATRRPRAG